MTSLLASPRLPESLWFSWPIADASATSASFSAFSLAINSPCLWATSRLLLSFSSEILRPDCVLTCHFKKSFFVELEAASACEEFRTEEVEINCVVDDGMAYAYEDEMAEASVE